MSNTTKPKPTNQPTTNQKTYLVKRFLPIFFVFSLIFLMLLGAISVYIFWQSNQTENSLQVQSVSRKKVSPDKIILNFALLKNGSEVDKLNQEADKKTKQIIAYLESVGVDRKDIVTRKNSYTDFQPASPGETRTMREKHNLSVNFELTLKNLENNFELPNQILQEVSQLGVNQFGWNDYQISNQAEICQELETQALEKARDLAEKRVKALGGGRIVSIQVSNLYGCDDGVVSMPFSGRDMAISESQPSTTSPAPEVLTGTKELQARAVIKVYYK